MNKKPKALILKTDGTNCDNELFFAFKLAGAESKFVHINDLRNKKENLNSFNILGIPGGFSYGDDVVSGKILAVELTSFFAEELKKFIHRKNTAVIGICNGFQVLIRTGLLPFSNVGKMDATLTNNDSGHFECRWVRLKTDGASKSKFIKNLNSDSLCFQVAHGEGKFFADDKTLEKIEKQNLVAFRYINGAQSQTQEYPYNPNGSLNAIAGISDPTGRILGLMPHPERFVTIEQYPNWRREKRKPQGLPIFKNMINFVKHS